MNLPSVKQQWRQNKRQEKAAIGEALRKTCCNAA